MDNIESNDELYKKIINIADDKFDEIVKDNKKIKNEILFDIYDVKKNYDKKIIDIMERGGDIFKKSIETIIENKNQEHNKKLEIENLKQEILFYLLSSHHDANYHNGMKRNFVNFKERIVIFLSNKEKSKHTDFYNNIKNNQNNFFSTDMMRKLDKYYKLVLN